MMKVKPTQKELNDFYDQYKNKVIVNKKQDIEELKIKWKFLLENEKWNDLIDQLLTDLCVYDAYYCFTVSVWHGNIVFDFHNKEELIDHLHRTIDAIPCKILGEEKLPLRIAYIEFVRIIQTILNALEKGIIMNED